MSQSLLLTIHLNRPVATLRSMATEAECNSIDWNSPGRTNRFPAVSMEPQCMTIKATHSVRNRCSG